MKLIKTSLVVALAALPAASFAQDWSGPYAGVQIGGSDIDTSGAADLTGDGNSFGAFAGYNIVNGTVVYGGEIDYDGTEYVLDGTTNEVDSTTRLKGRVGADVGGGLIYGALGVVWASSDQLGDDTGLFYGFGYDYPIGNNLALGAEILQHEFDDYNDSSIDVSVTTFKARLSVQF